MASTNGSFKKDKKMKLDQLLNSMLGWFCSIFSH